MRCSPTRRYVSAFGYTQAKSLVFSEYGEPKSPKMTIELGTEKPAAVGGNEGVVEVVSVGADVKSFKPGDRAIMKHTAFGTWRTHAIAKDEHLLKIPDEFADISPLSAATISVNPCTAYRILKDFADLQPGDYFIQNGANSGINVVRDRPNIEELREELMGLGADIVVTEEECRRKSTHFLIKQLGEGAHIVTYGAMSKQPLSLSASALIFQDIHAHGFWVSRWSDKYPEEKAAMVEEIFRYIQKGEFKEVPFEKTVWNSNTKEEQLLNAVGNSGQAYGGRNRFLFLRSRC
ncbi:hypothetical protein BDD12DRAFT_836764, partial [Trichophaea hybrida]